MDLVLFVKSEDDVTAVVITEALINGDTSLTDCYSHVGQHSTCSWDWVSGSDVLQAEYSEYKGLMDELEGQGYTNLRVLTFEEVYDAMGGIGFEFLDDEPDGALPLGDGPVLIPSLTGLISIMVSDEFIQKTMTAAVSEMLGQEVTATGLQEIYRNLQAGRIPNEDDRDGWEIAIKL